MTTEKKPDPERSAAAKRAWVTIRANRAALAAKRLTTADPEAPVLSPSACKPEPPMPTSKPAKVIPITKAAPVPVQLVAEAINGLPATAVARERLAYALAICDRVAVREKASPILGHALVEAKLGILTFRVSDIDRYVIVSIPAAGATFAPRLLSFRAIAEQLKSKDDTKPVVGIAVAPDALHVQIDGRVVKVPNVTTWKPEEFPAMPKPDFEGSADRVVTRTVDIDAFRDAANFVRRCVSTDETRYVMKDILIDGEMLVSTDTHRLHVAENGGFERFPENVTQRISTRAVEVVDLASRLGTLDTKIVLQSLTNAVGNKRADKRTGDIVADVKAPREEPNMPWNLFTIGDLETMVYVYDSIAAGEFPPWRQVLPKKWTRAYVVDAAPVSKALVVAKKVTKKEKVHGVTLTLNGKLEVEAKSSDGEVAETIELAETCGKDFVCSLSADYLAQAIDGAKTVKIEATKDDEPIRFSDETRKRFALIMPMRR